MSHGRHTTDANDFPADYGNEKECGEGVARAIKDGLVKREDLFIVSKLWNSFHDGDRVEPICKKQLADWYVSYEQTKFPGLARSQGVFILASSAPLCDEPEGHRSREQLRQPRRYVLEHAENNSPLTMN